jgi:hypothetical protein
MSMLLRLDACKDRQPLPVERSHGIGMIHARPVRQSLLPVGREHCRRTEVSNADAFDNDSVCGRIVGSQLIKQGAGQRRLMLQDSGSQPQRAALGVTHCG